MYTHRYLSIRTLNPVQLTIKHIQQTCYLIVHACVCVCTCARTHVCPISTWVHTCSTEAHIQPSIYSALFLIHLYMHIHTHIHTLYYLLHTQIHTKSCFYFGFGICWQLYKSLSVIGHCDPKNLFS